MSRNYEETMDSHERGAGALPVWVALVISIASTLVALGVVYGKLGGRFDLMEYRLGQIEIRLKANQ